MDVIDLSFATKHRSKNKPRKIATIANAKKVDNFDGKTESAIVQIVEQL